MVVIKGDFPVGAVVRSIAGRDRKRIFIVVGISEDHGKTRVFLADGELHRLSDPKCKNPCHLEVMDVLTAEEKLRLEAADDLILRDILKKYDPKLSDEV